MNYKFQIILPSDPIDKNKIIDRFKDEANAMHQIGVNIGTKAMADATVLMYRGFTILEEEKYPKDPRFINTFKHNSNYLYLSSYFPYISDLSIETFFVDELNANTETLISAKGWDNAFIKKDVQALEHIEEGKSIWPQTSFEEMLKLYNKYPFEGKYCIRKYMDSQKIIKEEERYWVFNGNIYHRHNKIPNVVKEAAKRLNTMGSKYYTIDATPDFVVEVNPGESSDRHAVNSAELFASWIKKEFVK